MIVGVFIGLALIVYMNKGYAKKLKANSKHLESTT